MNPVGLIGVIVLAVILDISWAAYYLAVQFVFASGLTRGIEIFVAIPLMIYPIYSELPWWYNLLIFQHLLVACTFLTGNRLVEEDKIDEDTAYITKKFARQISAILLWISVIGSFYWFFTNR